jgi:hypothetical protein
VKEASQERARNNKRERHVETSDDLYFFPSRALAELRHVTIISPKREHSGTEILLRKDLKTIKFEELRGKSFELIRVVEMLCEVCQKPLNAKEKALRKVQIETSEDYQNLLNRATVHDRAEIDLEKGKIYFYDHDFPGDIHPECIEKL